MNSSLMSDDHLLIMVITKCYSEQCLVSVNRSSIMHLLTINYAFFVLQLPDLKWFSVFWRRINSLSYTFTTVSLKDYRTRWIKPRLISQSELQIEPPAMLRAEKHETVAFTLHYKQDYSGCKFSYSHHTRTYVFLCRPLQAAEPTWREQKKNWLFTWNQQILPANFHIIRNIFFLPSRPRAFPRTFPPGRTAASRSHFCFFIPHTQSSTEHHCPPG